MELSFAKCESIVNTLPIGLYTGRRIDISLEEKEATSFYSPTEDKIVISYPVIAQRMKQVSDCNEEEAVRSMLYHEVSHAILTPTNNNLESSFITNCFEDERIETVLRHYYHGVDFRKQLYDLHGGHAPKPSDADSAYFNAVRFGLGTAKVQEEVNRILHEYEGINRNTPRYSYDNYYNCYHYEENLYNLYKLIEKEWRKHPEAFEDKDGEGMEQPQNMDTIKSQGAGGGSDENGEEQSDCEGEGEVEGDVEGKEVGEPAEKPYKGEPHETTMNPDQLKRMIGAAISSKGNLKPEQAERLDSFQKTAEMIIGNFNKKNKGGSGINAYSGVFNPRAVSRQDYRYFERAMTTQGNNKFGTCHLNLIIDASGSFERNAPLVNGILAVLSEIERKNRNFTMDVAFINEEFKMCKTVRDRFLVADGGNSVPENMKEILMKMQKPNTCNYTIVLFDGDAICNHVPSNPCKVFSAFDMKQTTLITSRDNTSYMRPPFTSTKVVVTDEYTEKLVENITRALTIAFG